ncbi:hypothetical protein D3C81_887000 [compost metagenome]
MLDLEGLHLAEHELAGLGRRGGEAVRRLQGADLRHQREQFRLMQRVVDVHGGRGEDRRGLVEQLWHVLVGGMVAHLVVRLLLHVQQPALEQTGAAADLPEAAEQLQQAALDDAQLLGAGADRALQAGDQQAAQFAQVAGGVGQLREADHFQAGEQFADLRLGQFVLADLGVEGADVAELVVDPAPQHADAVAQGFAEGVDMLLEVRQVGVRRGVVALVAGFLVVRSEGLEGDQCAAGVGVDLPVAVVAQGLFQQRAHHPAQVQVGAGLGAVEDAVLDQALLHRRLQRLVGQGAGQVGVHDRLGMPAQLAQEAHPGLMQVAAHSRLPWLAVSARCSRSRLSVSSMKRITSYR